MDSKVTFGSRLQLLQRQISTALKTSNILRQHPTKTKPRNESKTLQILSIVLSMSVIGKTLEKQKGHFNCT